MSAGSTSALDEESAQAYREVSSLLKDDPTRSPDARRRDAQRAVGVLRGDGFPTPEDLGVRVEIDTIVGADGRSIPTRILIPSHVTTDVIVIYAHGGGWVEGSAESAEPDAARLARDVRSPVLVVDYRRAPEHPFPEPLLDVLDAARAIQRANPGIRIAFAGDSAGGNLAAAASFALRDDGVPVAAQLLLYPALDPGYWLFAADRDVEHPLLSPADMAYFARAYLGPKSSSVVTGNGSLYAAPRRVADLSGLPPTVVATAKHDILHDEGAAFAARMISAGVAVMAISHPHLGHAFQQLTHRSAAADAAIKRLYALFSLLLHQ